MRKITLKVDSQKGLYNNSKGQQGLVGFQDEKNLVFSSSTSVAKKSGLFSFFFFKTSVELLLILSLYEEENIFS